MRLPSRFLLIALALTALALAMSAPAGAFDVNEVRARYTVTSWTEKDGMPSSYVRAIAQDHDGYLWLATYSGLVRFDGVRFVAWKPHDGPPLPSEDLSALLVARDGSLWVGGGGSVTHLAGGRVVYTRSSGDGLFAGNVSELLEDTAGAIWVGSQGGLSRFDGKHWEKFGAQYGLPEMSTLSLLQDASGTLWVGTSVGLFQRPPSAKVFEPVPSLAYTIEDIAQDSAGRIVVTHPTHLLSELSSPSRDHPEWSRWHGTRLLRDREGNLWAGTRGHALVRISGKQSARGPVVERLTREDGLSADSVQALVEDREGDIWVGTPFGLNRLSENAVIPVPMVRGTSAHIRSVTAAEDGSIWAATEESILHFSGQDEKQYDWSPDRTLIAVHSDWQTGTLWVSTNQGLVRFASGRFTPFPLPGGLTLNRIRSITTDKEGHLWLCDADKGVFRSTDRSLAAFDLIAGDKPASSVYSSRDGRVWISFINGTIGSYQDGQLRSFSQADGLPGGAATAVHEDRNGTIWVGTHQGLSRFENGRFVMLDSANGFPGTGPVAIEDDEDGYLWLGVTGLGVLRVSEKEFDRSVVDRAHKIQYQLYGAADGLRATPVRQFGTPASARGASGQMWFLTGNGLAVVDPLRLRAARPPTPLLVEALVEDILTDNEQYEPVAELKLPPDTSKFQIDYTLLSLAPVSQISFRYRLEGFDQRWIDAGTRRQAFYTNVPPGHYRFRVEADRDGAPTSTAAVLGFSVEPRFYQTSWFALACAVLGSLGLWGLWQLRLQQVRRRFAVVLDERARMGREIHDTLLQGLVGVAVQFKVIAEHLHSSPDAAKERLDRLRKLVEHYICETRQSIWDLRSPTLEVTDLATALRQAGEAITADKNVNFELVVTGKPYSCDLKVEEQLLRVGREALSNAVRHADPNRVRVDLVYAHNAVRLRVTDDGSGFSPDDPGFNAGTHWGLTSMRERAQQINAQFQLASTPGKGTELELIVPATAR